MALIDEVHRKAIRHCMKRNIPFTFFFLPDDDKPSFYAQTDDDVNAAHNFVIGEFNSSYTISIADQYSAEDVVKINCCFDELYDDNDFETDKIEYISSINQLVNELKSSGNKVVVSRTKIIRKFDKSKICDVAEEYFSANKNCFRALYYTPLHGMWLVATPELLLNFDKDSRSYSTMALAGTRPTMPKDSPWDDKNIREHRYVTDYIVDKLKSLDLTPSVSEPFSLNHGKIEHICQRISGISPIVNAKTIISALNPTPAIAGYPLEYALSEIRKIEKHQRECYGGYISVEDDNHSVSYVNLRSCRIDNDSVCLYAGGGITALSNAEDEWNETEAKMSQLVNIFSHIK